MKVLDLTLPTPAENLACDEALLDTAEAGQSEEILRFWESPVPFVVVGYANKLATEVNVPACEARGVPILRRCSGGGTVVQGPGCLNYALILRLTAAGSTHTISAANQFIMERNRAAIESCSRSSRRKSAQTECPSAATGEFEVRGHTDLVVVTRHASRVTSLKFSGNSQRRRKNFLLFHGTFLLHFDLPLVGELLRMPSLQPDYRDGRTHQDFVTNLEVSASSVKNALLETWRAAETTNDFPTASIASLLQEKYSREEWHRKF